MELIEHEQGFFECVRGDFTDDFIIQQINQRADVVTTEHRSQQLGRFGATEQRTFFSTVCDSSQITRFDFGGIIDTRRYTMHDQIQ